MPATRQSPRSKRRQADESEEKSGSAVDSAKVETDDESTPEEQSGTVGSSQSEVPIQEPEEPAVINCDVYALNGASTRLYKSVLKNFKASAISTATGQDEHSGNFVISPISVFDNLHLAYSLSKGQTKDELENQFFGFAQNLDAQSGVSVHSKPEGLQANIQQIQHLMSQGQTKPSVAPAVTSGRGRKPLPKPAPAPNYHLKAGQSLVVSSHLQVDSQHQSNKNILAVDLTDKEKAKDHINEQIENQTEQRVANMVKVDKIPPKNNGALLVSAAHFTADWERKFINKSKSFYPTPARGLLEGLPLSLEDFHNADGTVKKVIMVHLEEKIFLTRDEELKVTMMELPFSQYSMNLIIVLPDDTTSGGLRKFEESINHQTFELLQKNAQMPLTRVYLPKFNVESQVSLQKSLTDMGVQHIFSSGSMFSSSTDWADFTSSGSEALTHCTDVLHGASFSISAEGDRSGSGQRGAGGGGGVGRKRGRGDISGGNGEDAVATNPECIQLEGARVANGVHVNRPFFFLVQSSFPQVWTLMGHIQQLDESDSALWRHLNVSS